MRLLVHELQSRAAGEASSPEHVVQFARAALVVHDHTQRGASAGVLPTRTVREALVLVCMAAEALQGLAGSAAEAEAEVPPSGVPAAADGWTRLLRRSVETLRRIGEGGGGCVTVF